jgi:hypothetical protein
MDNVPVHQQSHHLQSLSEGMDKMDNVDKPLVIMDGQARPPIGALPCP